MLHNTPHEHLVTALKKKKLDSLCKHKVKARRTQRGGDCGWCVTAAGIVALVFFLGDREGQLPLAAWSGFQKPVVQAATHLSL